VRENGRIVGGEGWQEKVHNREEWKKLLRTAKELSHSAFANGMGESVAPTPSFHPHDSTLTYSFHEAASFLRS